MRKKHARRIVCGIKCRRLRTHVENLQGTRHPLADPEALERAADYVWNNLTAAGCDVYAHPFLEDEKEYRNIVGVQRGTSDPDRKVVVTAHYDTVSTTPGANDNASGIAGLIEIARVLGRLTFSGSLVFIGFCLEEKKVEGRPDSAICRGSGALVRHAREQGWKVDAVINLEEIGFAGEDVAQKAPPGIPIPIPEKGDFVAIIGNEISAPLVRGLVREIEDNRLRLPSVPLVVPANGEIFPDLRRSDHASFWDAGYPAIMLTDTADFRTPHYHKPSDTIETMNFSFAANVCRAAACLAAGVARGELL